MLLTSVKDFLRRRRPGTQSAVPDAAFERMSRPDLPRPGPAPMEAVIPQAPPSYQGYVDELSTVHAHGWVHDINDPGKHVVYEVVLPRTGEVLASGLADQFRHGLAASGIGDGTHGFWTRLSRSLSEPERQAAVVRVGGGDCQLKRPAHAVSAFEPIWHVAMDIVDNCNLRCPFCLYDYEHTKATHFMSPETLDAALRFVPYAKDGEFWFSCLHEPTLHPQLIDFIERVPHEYRRKLFFTTNLAKRMPAQYFDWLAGNGMHHINVSIESRDPTLYERMRKGARHRIFVENWDVLMGALARSTKPTPIRYITMVYKSNLRELPDLARYLIEERQASQVEFRYTFDVAHLPPDFRASEFLDEAEWDWLAGELASLPADKILLLRPPSAATAEQAEPEAAPSVTESPAFLPGRAMFRLSWDGTLKVVGVLAASRHDNAIEQTVLETNIRDIADPATFVETMLASPGGASSA